MREVCKNCNRVFSDNFIFCPNCGSNLTIPETIADFANIPQKDEIETVFLEAYKVLKSQLDDLKWVVEKHHMQKIHLESLNTELHKQSLRHKDTSKYQLSISSKIKEMEKRTWSNLRLKLTGDFENKLDYQEEEAIRIINELNSITHEQEQLQRQIDHAESQFGELEILLETRENLEHRLWEIVNKATKGMKDIEEDKIENLLNRLIAKFDPLVVEKSRYQTALGYLHMSLEYFRGAHIDIDKTQETIIGKNTLLKETLSKSVFSDIRNTVKDAVQFLDQAQSILASKNSKDPDNDSELFEGSNVWEKFLKNFIKDFKTGFRTRDQTKIQLVKSVADVNKLIAWVNSKLNNLNFKVDELLKEIKVVENDLMKERLRILDESI